MRRVTLAFVGTVIGTAALVGAKSHQGTPGSVAANEAANQGGAPPGGALGGELGGDDQGDDDQPASPPGGSPTANQPGPSATPGPHPSGTGTATAPAPTATKTTGSTPAAHTVSGFTCNTRYGSVRVSVTVTGNHIDDVSYTDRTSEPRSAPSKLRTEVLNEQSGTNLTVTSGATYTSAAFIASVQNALYGTPLNTNTAPFKGHVTSCG